MREHHLAIFVAKVANSQQIVAEAIYEVAKQSWRVVWEGQRAGRVRLLCLAGRYFHAYLGRSPVHVGHGGISPEVPATGAGVNNGCVDGGVFHRCIGAGDTSRCATSLPLGLPFVF